MPNIPTLVVACVQKIWLSHLTLGTARRELPDELVAWAGGNGKPPTPTADPGETAAGRPLPWGSDGSVSRSGKGRTRMPPPRAPEEARLPPPPLLARGAALIVGGTYSSLLPELFEWAPGRRIPRPFFQRSRSYSTDWVKLAREQPGLARETPFRAGGAGAGGLAGLKPGVGRTCTRIMIFASAFGATGSARERVPLLRQWRQADPTAAREALSAIWGTLNPPQPGTAAGDLLRRFVLRGHRLSDRGPGSPAGRASRQRAAHLLLLIGESGGALGLPDAGPGRPSTRTARWERVIDDPVDQEILQRYGGLPKRTDLPTHLLGILPPYVWRNLQEAGYRDFLRGPRRKRVDRRHPRRYRSRRTKWPPAPLVEVLSVRAKHSLSEAELRGLVGVLSGEVFTATFPRATEPGGSTLSPRWGRPSNWRYLRPTAGRSASRRPP